MRHVISNPGKQLSMSERGSVERQAINTPIQGGAADVVMLAMIRLHHDERLAKMGWRLLLQVARGAPARRGNSAFLARCSCALCFGRGCVGQASSSSHRARRFCHAV